MQNTARIALLQGQIKQAEAEIAAGNGNPEHWRWWIQNRKAKLKQERKQPPAEATSSLPYRQLRKS